MSWLPKQRVVVPVDFSEDSIDAIDLAKQFVEDASHIHVVHVLPQLSAMEPGVVSGDVTDETRKAHVEKQIRKRLKDDHDHEGLTIAVRIGVSHRQIVRYADEVKADLIVIPSHGRTGAAHLLLGSTAERVVHNAHCPVLVVKKPRE